MSLKFYKTIYIRYFVLFPLLVLISGIFLIANISNLLNHYDILNNTLFLGLNIYIIYHLSTYLLRIIKIGRPYLELNAEGLVYADFWQPRQYIRYQDMTKTRVTPRALGQDVHFALSIFTWNHHLQSMTGFGEHQLKLMISISPRIYENLDERFPSHLTLLKYMNPNQRITFLESLMTQPDFDITRLMSDQQVKLFRQDQVILIQPKLNTTH